MTYLKVLHWSLPAGAEQTHNNMSGQVPNIRHIIH